MRDGNENKQRIMTDSPLSIAERLVNWTVGQHSIETQEEDTLSLSLPSIGLDETTRILYLGGAIERSSQRSQHLQYVAVVVAFDS